ncbi:hypothetical protein ALNOE001_16940 [Candidatus Methanobinarius endosymbioticus]|uniref:Uncharacterized protein n=1 Tax=Candidatus Methanobinarius endosymbioticus TaxID=2006182 RepID=A0A366M8V9_9EURY|nr:hypothetical protein ALNOE001_16940 [Candidatus Methanobinarius endosymbioticus]
MLNKTITDSNNGDRIILDSGIYTNNVTDVIVNKNLTIVGKDKKNTIIDARQQGKIFRIYGQVTLINLTLINGYLGVHENGGVITNMKKTGVPIIPIILILLSILG